MPRMDKKDEGRSRNEQEIETRYVLNSIDVRVGSRVRLRRIAAGLTEEELGAILGIAAFRVQACERGEKRFGAELLYEVATALNCLPSVFFDEM